MSVLTKKQIEILAKSKRAVVGYDPDKPIGESELFTEDILDTIAAKDARIAELEKALDNVMLHGHLLAFSYVPITDPEYELCERWTKAYEMARAALAKKQNA